MRSTASRPRRRCTRFLGYAWIPPELRENGGELAAARKGELPELVSLGDLRGDLHTHTTWSDGKDSLETMVAAAQARGYAYYAICDHSQRLRGDLLEQQSEQIDALNERVAPFRILKGIEVNVRPDGSLDVSDDELATRDWVVASVHSRFDHNPTERVLAAMESPYVDCIGHPTNRKIGQRAPAPIDLDRVLEKAVETGTFLELNSQPDRLDLSDVHAPRRARRRREGRDRLGRPSAVGARLRDARHRPGTPGVADPRRRAQHADVEADREAEEEALTFHDDLALAAEWVEAYLAGVGERPVAATVDPGDVRAALPAAPPQQGEPFADVLRDVDELILPGLTHWNHPRFFAWFANTGSEPGILAELLIAALNVERDDVARRRRRRPSSSS